ncbi:MAG: sodium/calcium exchanger protein [Gammaproteobacteria bacterium]|nr:sodium/calcium exchanger protein [Gammaproteobacteria bacterium]
MSTASPSVARHLNTPALLVGMLVIGFGTSAPEISVSAIATLNGNPQIGLGNAYGSNLFNTLAVVGIATAIQPNTPPPELLPRDILVMGILTLSLFALGCGFRGQGRINRYEGALLLAIKLGYTTHLVCGGVCR